MRYEVPCKMQQQTTSRVMQQNWTDTDTIIRYVARLVLKIRTDIQTYNTFRSASARANSNVMWK